MGRGHRHCRGCPAWHIFGESSVGRPYPSHRCFRCLLNSQQYCVPCCCPRSASGFCMGDEPRRRRWRFPGCSVSHAEDHHVVGEMLSGPHTRHWHPADVTGLHLRPSLKSQLLLNKEWAAVDSVDKAQRGLLVDRPRVRSLVLVLPPELRRPIPRHPPERGVDLRTSSPCNLGEDDVGCGEDHGERQVK